MNNTASHKLNMKHIIQLIISNPLNLFLAISILISLTAIIVNIATDGYIFKSLFMSDSYLFSDYFYHIAGGSDTANMYSLGDPYCFPAFSYIMYSILLSFVPYKDPDTILNWQNYMNNGNSMAVYVFYSMLCCMLLIYTIIKCFKTYKFKYSVLLPVALLISYPVLFTNVQRGNSTFLVAVLITLALVLSDSDNPIESEISLILIAISAAYKIYPAILGLIWVKQKEWKKVIRLVIYGAVLFFVPFMFIGGLQGFKDVIITWTDYAAMADPEKTNTVIGLGLYICEKIGLSGNPADIFSKCLQYAFGIFCLVFFALSKKKWQTSFFLTGILVSFLASNWQYTSVYYFAPLLLFLRDYEQMPDSSTRKSEKTNIYLMVVGFAMIFSADWLMVYFRYGVITGFFGLSYLLLIISAVDVIIYRKEMKTRKIATSE